MRLTPGTQLGGYIVTGLLGEGGMGEVYRATDPKLRRDVAIKVLSAARAHDADRLARFKREAHVLASLNHPNIAQIFGVVESDDGIAIVMELIEGPTLAELVAASKKGNGARTQGLAMAEALTLARQLADALESAHEQGVVHRDLKPANVKVRLDGVLKVLDFGLAKVLQTDDVEAMDSPTISSHHTERGMIVGTPAYMAPEQARGKTVDRRTDIWAFGAVLYEMLTGVRAFGGETSTDTFAAVIREDVDWTRLPPATPSGVRHLLQRCLERDPRLRLRDIGEARIALSSPQEPGPVVPTFDRAPVSRISRTRRAIYDVATVAGIGVLLFAAKLWTDAHPPIAARLGELESTALAQLVLPDGGSMAPWTRNDLGLPVVIDISPLRIDRTRITDRAMLEGLVDALERMDAAAIGLDIDLSPTDAGAFVTTSDGTLFKKWVDYGNVRVGVFRHAGDTPDNWLGNPEFRKLAAGILLDMDEPGTAIQYTIAGVNGQPRSPSPDEYLLQMPAALFEVTHPGSRAALVSSPRLKRSSVNQLLFEGTFPIDVRFKELVAQVPYTEPVDLKNWTKTIEHRVVLVGDMKDAGDSRCVQAGPEPIAGVMIHAAALATLNKGFLRAIDDRTSLVYDLLFGALGIGTIFGIRYLFDRAVRRGQLTNRAAGIMAFSTAALVVIAVWWSVVSIDRMLWPDPAWFAVLLILAPYSRDLSRSVISTARLFGGNASRG